MRLFLLQRETEIIQMSKNSELPEYTMIHPTMYSAMVIEQGRPL